jgi:tRNA-Thr(GGU) m(6)t(6)A37 methyltransferase TsaA
MPRGQDDRIIYRPIGRVENAFDEPAAMDVLLAAESRIILSPELTEGLSGVHPGEKLLVLFHLHRSIGYELLQHPRGDVTRPRRGVFALRSPRRPNPIGATVVDVVAVEGHVLRVRGLDALNGTPVLDLKPVGPEEGCTRS